jgi:hypothetical protein
VFALFVLFFCFQITLINAERVSKESIASNQKLNFSLDQLNAKFDEINEAEGKKRSFLLEESIENASSHLENTEVLEYLKKIVSRFGLGESAAGDILVEKLIFAIQKDRKSGPHLDQKKKELLICILDRGRGQNLFDTTLNLLLKECLLIEDKENRLKFIKLFLEYYDRKLDEQLKDSALSLTTPSVSADLKSKS